MIKNGYLIEENYFGKQGKDVLNPIYSVSKSLTSTLIGIAIQEGFIESIDEIVLDFFPDYEFENADSAKNNMTIYHLLTMTSGLDWDEWWVSYSSIRNDLTAVKAQSDWVQYILDKPMVHDPGTVIDYNTGASHILSAILDRSTDGYEAFANEYLFDPLGIEDYFFQTDPQNIVRGGEGISLRSIDMAKLGYFYSMNGSWNGVSILSPEWISSATTPIFEFDPVYSYGYQWWIAQSTKYETFFAWGWSGQRIFVIPERELVGVFTGFEDSSSVYLFFINQFIIPPTYYDPLTESISSESDPLTESSSGEGESLISVLGFSAPIILIVMIKRRYLPR